MLRRTSRSVISQMVVMDSSGAPREDGDSPAAAPAEQQQQQPQMQPHRPQTTASWYDPQQVGQETAVVPSNSEDVVDQVSSFPAYFSQMAGATNPANSVSAYLNGKTGQPFFICRFRYALISLPKQVGMMLRRCQLHPPPSIVLLLPSPPPRQSTIRRD